MDNDPNIVVISVGKNFESKLEGLFAKYPQRCFDAGLSADLAADHVAGLALNGMKPYISSDSSFLARAYDQLANDLSGKLPVLFGISCHLDIDNGRHAPPDIRYLRTLPDSIIAQGKDASEIRSLIRCGFSHDKPLFIRYSRENIRNIKECGTKDIAIGKWEIINNLKDPGLNIISCGVSVNRIAKTIADNELNYSLINARFIRPLDEKMLKKVLSSGKRIYLYCAEESADLSEEIRLFAIENDLPCRITEFGNCGCMASDRSASSDISAVFERIKNDKKQDK
jgi:1-deoxy-D-xylulose-5-phosphate synthase